MKTRFIFVCGGVMSGIGKGVATASMGALLKTAGYSATCIKIDPYVNVDAGTMNPLEHGEVFVTEDGTECDQDVGHYERFLQKNILDINYITTGRVYQTVIQKERNFEFEGKCVEVVPHIPQEVIRRIKLVAQKSKVDFVLIEIGGTVGEYQNLLFLEAARLLKLRYPQNVIFVLVSYLPIPKTIGEMKTKPTQYAVRTLNSAGIQPDVIIGRSEKPLDKERKEKISINCGVDMEDIISAPDVKSLYEVPLNLERENLTERILQKFKLKRKKKDLSSWKNLFEKIKNPKRRVKIGIVGKYFRTGEFILMDAYISVIEAIKHASYFFYAEPQIFWLDAEDYERNKNNLKELKEFDGIIIPGGFGKRGVGGKILAIEFCRENKIPFLGLCLGMQLMAVEFARNVCKLSDAHSTEFKENPLHKIVDLMPEQKEKLKRKEYGGTMRLGAWKCEIKKGTLAYACYQKSVVYERHRHRYEFQNKYRKIFEKNGIVFSGINPEKDLVEMMELKGHPFFLGTQFHPEFKSYPLSPHPLFKGFIKTALEFRKAF